MPRYNKKFRDPAQVELGYVEHESLQRNRAMQGAVSSEENVADLKPSSAPYVAGKTAPLVKHEKAQSPLHTL